MDLGAHMSHVQVIQSILSILSKSLRFCISACHVSRGAKIRVHLRNSHKKRCTAPGNSDLLRPNPAYSRSPSPRPGVGFIPFKVAQGHSTLSKPIQGFLEKIFL
jgi:hypothetical protein